MVISSVRKPSISTFGYFEKRRIVRMATSRQARIAALGDAMQAYQRSTQAFDDAVGAVLDLNPADLRGLDWLVDGPKTAGELREGTGLSAAATTTLIDRLERKGFARRVADPVDRRRVLVEMTASGADRVGRLYGPLVLEGQGLLADIPDELLGAMLEWLVQARAITDRHRQRIRAGATVEDEPLASR
jgi:DNA-binding MarR family transcriptional regulator